MRPTSARIIEHKQVLTPLDLERRFGITGGNIFHGEMSARPDVRHAPGGRLGALPHAGRRACICAAPARIPGGGVMGAPGYNAAREMLKDKPKWRFVERAAADFISPPAAA